MSESISLCILRLEIENDHEIPKSFSYCASDLHSANIKSRDTASYASVVKTSGPSSSEEKSPVELNLTCRGQRGFGDFTIESYFSVNFETKSEMKAAEDKTDRHTEDFRPIKDGQSPGPSSDDHRPSSSQSTRPKSHTPPLKSPHMIYFYSGNPMVEKTRGILHLYKDDHITSLKSEVPRSELICMLAVPAAYTIHDLLNFTAAVHEGIEYLRIVRDSTPNQYMVLVKFRTQKLADEFFNTYNNVTYNSIEPDICLLTYVAKMETLKEEEEVSLPVPGLTELPNCPVCLERMDESVDGILTILCNHAFHMKCLAQWGDTSCPVCRYIQTPEEVVDNRCMTCGSQESLWICLICGNIGCGRYTGQHAHSHFVETQHTYSMQLGNNRVWDYAGDNYVHRLVQNKGDGKLVEVDEGGRVVHEEKVDSLALEYTYLLTSQLESQRLYFEEKMNQIEENGKLTAQELDHRLQKEREINKDIQLKLRETEKDKHSMDKKCNHLHSRLTKVLSELQEEKQMNKCLLENQQVWQKKVLTLESQVKDLTCTKEKEITELREQLRDVMFYLEAQQKLSSATEISQEEIQDGKITLGASGNTPSPISRRGRKKDR
ncbi:BRAP [Mytilus edulis]|uniref:BRAP n=1 Tax=Mytilus edulis TaxID=6550 RepID=A0A8S3QI67_MYTED|nr:BRAP [Mytilus edulis]